MARTRQQAKQRKAKRLEQERKAAEQARQRGGGDAATQDTIAEIEQAQLDAATELDEAQQDEVGAGREAARSAAAAEAATAAEAVTTGRAEPATEPDGAPTKPSRRERRARQAEVETPRKQPQRARERARPQRKERKKEDVRQRGRVVNFLIQVWAELRRVQWPNRTQVTQATAVVVIFCLVAGAYLGLLDYVFNKLVNLLL
jgi:preprotein translocase SecE subunit